MLLSILSQVFSAHKAIQVREPYERLLSAYRCLASSLVFSNQFCYHVQKFIFVFRFVFEDPAGLRNTDNIAAILREAFPHLPKAKVSRNVEHCFK